MGVSYVRCVSPNSCVRGKRFYDLLSQQRLDEFGHVVAKPNPVARGVVVAGFANFMLDVQAFLDESYFRHDAELGSQLGEEICKLLQVAVADSVGDELEAVAQVLDPSFD